MAIKAGQILFDAQGAVIDRIQTGGATNLNIPQERIYEAGNYQTVAVIRDIPDLSFDVQSLDTSAEVEAALTGIPAGTSLTAGQAFNFDTAMPVHIISPFKAGNGAFNIVRGIIVPALYLENVTYRFGVKQNSEENFTLHGDSIYYIPGSPYYQTYTTTSGTNQTYAFAHTAIPYTEGSSTIYALGVCAKNPTTHAYRKLFLGSDFTNTSAGFTTSADWNAAGYTDIDVVYGSTTAATYNQAVNASAAVKPAAIRSKDVCVYVSDGAATPSLVKWSGVQTVEVTRKVTLDNLEEFCNSHYIDSTYNSADVTGTIAVRSIDYADLFNKVQQVTSVSGTNISGPFSGNPLALEVHVNNPDTGARIKTITVSDARFTPPPYSAQANQDLSVTFSWQSDSGTMTVYNGVGPNG